MSYDLNAEGTNGVGSETTVVALAGFTSEFNISVWNVDATAAPVIDAIHGVTSGGAIGVLGLSNADGVGVRGQVTRGTGDGVQGQGSGNFSGVAGFGGSGSSGDGTGVIGFGGGATGTGVRGIGAGGPNTVPDPLLGAVGLYGQGGGDPVTGLNAGDGVQGVTNTVFGAGVHGNSTGFNGTGVFGEANDGSEAWGVFGLSTTGFAGMFFGNVQITGDLLVNGAKSAVVRFPDASHRRLYCMESPESWFEDFGVSHLVNGQAQVELDPDFAAVVKSDTYHVFISEYEDNNALFVAKRTSTGFGVRPGPRKPQVAHSAIGSWPSGRTSRDRDFKR